MNTRSRVSSPRTQPASRFNGPSSGSARHRSSSTLSGPCSADHHNALRTSPAVSGTIRRPGAGRTIDFTPITAATASAKVN